jgi:hypothetical protein
MKHGLALGILPTAFLGALLLLWFLKQGNPLDPETPAPRVNIRQDLAVDEFAAQTPRAVTDAAEPVVNQLQAVQRQATGERSPAVFETESQHMDRLRDTWNRDPELALKLLEAGEARFGSGTAGAERQWIKIRALTNLERFVDARKTAREMLQRFPNDNWTRDVEHHVLDHPETEAERRE